MLSNNTQTSALPLANLPADPSVLAIQANQVLDDCLSSITPKQINLRIHPLSPEQLGAFMHILLKVEKIKRKRAAQSEVTQMHLDLPHLFKVPDGGSGMLRRMGIGRYALIDSAQQILALFKLNSI